MKSKNNISLKKKIIFSLIVFLISIIVLPLTAELILRANNYHYKDSGSALLNIIKFDPQIGYRFVPGDHQLNLMKFHINKWGYRGKEWEINKTAGKTRIAVIGDSSTFGLGSNDNETYPYLLEKKLNDSGYNAEVLNLGIIAYSSHQSIIDYKLNAVKFNPDIFILLLGNWNDYHTLNNFPNLTEDEYISRGLIKKSMPKAPPLYTKLRIGEYIYSLVEKYDGMKFQIEDKKLFKEGFYEKDLPEFVRRVPLEQFKNNLNFFINTAKEKDIPIIVLVPQIRPDIVKDKPIFNKYADSVREIKISGKMTKIDLAKIFKDEKPQKVWLDFAHYNPYGNELISNALLKEIVNILNKSDLKNNKQKNSKD